MNRNVLIFMVFLCMSKLIFSQSVDSLVNEALMNNLQLKALEYRINSADAKSRGVTLPPPVFGIEFSQVPIDKIDLWNEPVSQNLFISQMFMLGGKLSAMEEVEKQGITTAKKEYDAYKFSLISGIKNKYYELWMMEHHLALEEDILELYKQILSSSEKLFQVNKLRSSDILLLQAEIASLMTEISIMENDIESMIIELNNLLGRDLEDRELEVKHTFELDSIKYTEEELSSILIEKNPQIARMSSMIEMNRLETKAVNKELFPDLMLQGMIMRMPRGMIITSKELAATLEAGGVHGGMGEEPETEYMYSLMASITLPFAPWSSGRYSAKEEELLAEISGLSSERENMQREMLSELKMQLNSLKSRRQKITLYEGDVIPLYRRTFNAQLMDFQSGNLLINNLIDTIRMLLMKEEELAEEKSEYQKISANMEMIIGTEIKN